MKKLPQLFYQSGVAWLLATWLPQAWEIGRAHV